MSSPLVQRRSSNFTGVFIAGKGSNSALSAEENDYVKLLVESGELHALYLLDNRRITSNRGLEGAAFEFDTTAVIRKNSPLLLASDRLFGHVLVASVRNTTIDESLVRKKLNALKENIFVTSNQPFDLNANANSQEGGGAETSPWTCELGTHGHFVGLYKEESERALPSYYLVVHSDAGRVGAGMVDLIVKPRLDYITYDQLMDTTLYKKTSLYSLRNARRLLAEAADHLDLEILRMSDLWASTNNAHFDAPPDLGIEQSDTEYNTLRRITRPDGESMVFYSRSSDLNSCTGGCVAYLVDHAYGVVLYKGDPERERQGTGPWSNDACSAFPIGTGRITSTESLEARRLQMMRDRPTREFMNQILNWKGRAEKDQAISHERVGAYADFSQSTKEVHSLQLGAKYGYVRLKPVCVVIPPPRPAS